MKRYLNVDILFSLHSTGCAGKTWKRPDRHFQPYLELIALLCLCWQWSYLQQLRLKLLLFSFPEEQRPPSNLPGILSTQCPHIAGIHFNFVKERGTESHHVHQLYYSPLYLTFASWLQSSSYTRSSKGLLCLSEDLTINLPPAILDLWFLDL